MRKSIFIATPMYGGNCSGIFAESLALVFKGLMDLGYDVKYCPLYNESLITRARNLLVEVFLKDGSDYLLFIDADQSFRYQDIDRMVKEDKDVLSAVVPLKTINWNTVSHAARNGKDNLGDYTGVFNFNCESSFDFEKPFEVKYAGTGMMLIKREVFINLKESVEKYKHNSLSLYNINYDDLIAEFFTTSIDKEGYLLSEDFHFCKIASDNGYKIYAVAYPEIAHAGTYFFKGSLKQQ